MFLKIWHFSASIYWLCDNGQQPITTLVTIALMLVVSWAEGRSCTCLRSYAMLAND